MPPMKRQARLVCAAVLLASGPASAQYENSSVWLSGGYMDLDEAAGVSNGIPIGIGYSGFIDSGFEWTVSVEGMLLTTRVDERKIFGLAGGPGLRYLFLQDWIRPWVGADLSYLHIFNFDDASNFVGLGPKVGIDFFLARQFSLGLRGQFNLYVTVRDQVELQTSLGGAAVAAAWF
jgi:outer membrane protein